MPAAVLPCGAGRGPGAPAPLSLAGMEARSVMSHAHAQALPHPHRGMSQDPGRIGGASSGEAQGSDPSCGLCVGGRLAVLGSGELAPGQSRTNASRVAGSPADCAPCPVQMGACRMGACRGEGALGRGQGSQPSCATSTLGGLGRQASVAPPTPSLYGGGRPPPRDLGPTLHGPFQLWISSLFWLLIKSICIFQSTFQLPPVSLDPSGGGVGTV